MKFSIITLFPGLIKSYISESIIKRAVENNKIEIEVLDLRDFSTLSHKQVDDYQFGGGKGMVLMCEPVVCAIESVRTKDSLVILTSPQGKTWDQQIAREFSIKHKHLIIVCGHYEGFDQRILEFVDLEISIGDYILTGGELASLVMLDSISRVIPGVIKDESHLNDSFENYLLDHPVYTKPVEFRNKKVPDVLLSGHHANIEKWRLEGKFLNTIQKRPDLLKKTQLTTKEKSILNEIISKNTKGEK